MLTLARILCNLVMVVCGFFNIIGWVRLFGGRIGTAFLIWVITWTVGALALSTRRYIVEQQVKAKLATVLATMSSKIQTKS